MSLFDRTKNIGTIIASCIKIDTEIKKTYYHFKDNQFFRQLDNLEKYNTKICSFSIYKCNYLSLLNHISNNIKSININSDNKTSPLNIDLCEVPTSISHLNINDYIFYLNANQKYDIGKILNITNKYYNIYDSGFVNIVEVENIINGKNLYVKMSQIIFSSPQLSFRCLEVTEYENNIIKNMIISPINETILRQNYTYNQEPPKNNREVECQFHTFETKIDSISSPTSHLDFKI